MTTTTTDTNSLAREYVNTAAQLTDCYLNETLVGWAGGTAGTKERLAALRHASEMITKAIAILESTGE